MITPTQFIYLAAKRTPEVTTPMGKKVTYSLEIALLKMRSPEQRQIIGNLLKLIRKIRNAYDIMISGVLYPSADKRCRVLPLHR